MRGFNLVVLSGNVVNAPEYGRTSSTDAMSFLLASSRPSSTGSVTAHVKVNVYIEGLLRICEMKLQKGKYVQVQGELMNRDGRSGQLVEIRARDILFFADKVPEGEEAYD